MWMKKKIKMSWFLEAKQIFTSKSKPKIYIFEIISPFSDKNYLIMIKKQKNWDMVMGFLEWNKNSLKNLSSLTSEISSTKKVITSSTNNIKTTIFCWIHGRQEYWIKNIHFHDNIKHNINNFCTKTLSTKLLHISTLKSFGHEKFVFIHEYGNYDNQIWLDSTVELLTSWLAVLVAMIHMLTVGTRVTKTLATLLTLERFLTAV